MNTDLTKLLTSQVETLTASAIVDVEIDIAPNNENSMILVCDEKYKNQVKVSFSGSALRVSAEGNFDNAGNMKVILKTSSLEEITVSGTADVSGVYKGSSLKIKVSGTGDVDLSGTVKKLDVTISGTGDASLKGLEAKDVTLKLSGTSDAKVFASDSCFVTISGVGDATVYGNPEKMQQKVSGLGSVKQAGAKKKSKETEREMPVFSANIFEESFKTMRAKSNDLAQEKARIKAEQEKQEKAKQFDAELILKKMQMDMQRKMQDLQNSYFNSSSIAKAPTEKPADSPAEPPLTTSQKLKNKFKGLL
jgi:Putative auto-transporter adhesin, head GIN domain